jgi:beta-galactosidase
MTTRETVFDAVAHGSLLIVALWFFVATPTAGQTVRKHESFDLGWRFTSGDPTNAEAAVFDDSGWRTLELPHDWGIEGPYS